MTKKFTIEIEYDYDEIRKDDILDAIKEIITACPYYIRMKEVSNKTNIEHTINLGWCENTDCEHEAIEPLYFVMLRPEFDSGVCYWCKECIIRDKNMIAKIDRRFKDEILL